MTAARTAGSATVCKVRYVALKCCDRFAGALVWSVNIVDIVVLCLFSFLLLYNFSYSEAFLYDSDLAGGQKQTKGRKSVDFGREDLGDV